MLVICLLAGYVSTAIPSEIDEQTLRDQADREEERLLRTGKVHEEPLLDEYLTAVTASLMPGADATPVRVTVLLRRRARRVRAAQRPALRPHRAPGPPRQ